MLSLNVTSLSKFRKFTTSTPEIIKKSISESHVAQFESDIVHSVCTTPNIFNAQSSDNFEKDKQKNAAPQVIDGTGAQMEELGVCAAEEPDVPKLLVIRAETPTDCHAMQVSPGTRQGD